MEHHFKPEIATLYGINIAIFLQNIAFWIQKNIANNDHFHKENYWTYNTSKAFTELFPYWSEDTIDRIIKKSQELGLLLVDTFNEKKYDKTRWFALTDKACGLFNLTLPRNRGKDSAKSREGFREIAGPIPDNKPDNKPDKNKSSCKIDQKQNNSSTKAFQKRFEPTKTKADLKSENEKRHEWANSADANACEKRNIEAHEQRKREEIEHGRLQRNNQAGNTNMRSVKDYLLQGDCVGEMLSPNSG